MKQLNKTTIGLAFVFISTIFISCGSYDDESTTILHIFILRLQK